MAIPFLDLNAQYRELKEEIDAGLARLIASSSFVGGEEVRSFETELAHYLGTSHAIGVANGTDALEIALEALDIGRGDVVLTVPFTFAATLEAIVRVGATPVFVDIREDDYTIDVDQAEEFLRSYAVKAIIAVHLYGQPADMNRLLSLARRHGVAIVEDAAQAQGARCRVEGETRYAGAIGDVGCFSFYPTKNLGAMGDAGAVVTAKPDIAERARLLAAHGEAEKYRHILPNGRNSRLDAIQAAVLRAKLRKLDEWNLARQKIAGLYAERLRGLALRLPPTPRDAVCVYHQYVVRCANRDRVREALHARGVPTAIHYPIALHQQDGFRSLFTPASRFPVSERCAAEVLSLPMYPHMPEEHVDIVAGALREVLG